MRYRSKKQKIVESKIWKSGKKSKQCIVVSYSRQKYWENKTGTPAWRWGRRPSWSQLNLCHTHHPTHGHIHKGSFLFHHFCLAQKIRTSVTVISVRTAIPPWRMVPTSVNLPSGCWAWRIRNLMASQMSRVSIETKYLATANTLATKAVILDEEKWYLLYASYSSMKYT